jgi:predicted amidohydrolase YtcJ
MGGGALFRDVATLRDAGELGLRFVWYFTESALDEAIGLGLRSGLGDEWLRVGGLKLFLDGTLGAQTAHMLDPYTGQPDNRGLPTLEADEFAARLQRAGEGRLSVAVHAIGDAAVRKALDGFSTLVASAARRPAGRHRIEHVQIVHPADLPRFAQLGVSASVQPVHFAADLDVARTYWAGRDSVPYPWGDLARAGAHLVFGSDAPVETPDVFAGLHAALSRRRPTRPETWLPDQAVGIDTALRAYTIAPAVAAGQDATLGSLEPGKRADLIVLDRDPYDVEPDDLLTTRVVATMIDGVWVWQRPDVDFAGPRG